jgi:two-component system, cell cycle sensor histidine kinase and response regulator CckA
MRERMATTLGDLVPSGGRAPMKRRDVTLSEAIAEAERLGADLERERARVQRLEEDLREARRLEALGRLASGVAHDFSNILAVISGYSELMLKRMDPTDPLRTGAESIRKAAVWGLNLTQHMLTSSRAATPALTLLDLNASVAGVVRTLAPLLGDAIEVVQTLDPRLGRVRVNAGQLEQALVNLVLNARDAMPAGGRLVIETRNADVEQTATGPLRAAMVRVNDNGCGMDAATMSRAFEPYFTTKPPGRGTGLGLATVFAFVSQSGGHIEVASEVGQGTTFTMYLPRHEAVEAPAAPAGDQPTTVLVVEPEPGVRDLIAEILELHGYRVLAARDLDEALAASLAHQDAIALVIVDLLLPGAAGDGVLQRLGPARAGAKVLYLSGDLEDTVEEYRGLRPGRGFLHKPFTVDALVQKTQEILTR